MTGITGWSGSEPVGREAEIQLAEMCTGLPPGGDLQTTVFSGGALGGAFRGSASASAEDRRLHGAIDGHPRWPDTATEELARNRGAGKALLDLYRRFGDDCPAAIGGDFALAVFDNDRDQLLIAIDRMGVRPLCFGVRASGEIVFGSTTDSVLTDAGISDELSPQALFHFVYFHVVPSPRTAFAAIRKLEPAQRLRYRGGRLVLDHYWQPEFDVQTDAPPAELAGRLVDTTRRAVHSCVSGEDSAAFLSGGLDSSTVSGLANEAVRKPIRAYSIGFDQAGYDEMEYARIAARHFGLDHREYYVTPDDVADSLHLIATVYDEPFGNSSAIPAYFCARQAREDGVTRLLAGDGGDELFAGNERYAKQRVFDVYDRLPSWMRRRLLNPIAAMLPEERPVLLRKIRRYVEQASVPMPERMQTYNFLHVNTPEAVFTPDFLAETDSAAPVEDMADWYARSAGCDLVDRMLVLDWKLTLADNDLRKVNRMCEVNGIDVVYPLLDSELVGFSTQIPTRLKMRGNKLRAFYKQAFAEFLPSEILYKEKHGFGLPFGEWLASSARLRDIVMPSIERLKGRAVFRDDFLDGLLNRHRNEHAAYYGNIIWVLSMLDNWLEERATSRRGKGIRNRGFG